MGKQSTKNKKLSGGKSGDDNVKPSTGNENSPRTGNENSPRAGNENSPSGIVGDIMEKQSTKMKKLSGGKSGDNNVKHSTGNENSPRTHDKDTAVFISMSQKLKDEGNRLFQRRDLEGAMLNYEKALKLLPGNHIDVSYLHSNMAACYMQMGITEYPRAIHECNLALEVTPKYSKALLKRARCYEALNRLELALRDVNSVLKMEPRNIMATEIAERVKTTMEQRGGTGSDVIPVDMIPVPEYIEPHVAALVSRLKEKARKKRSGKIAERVKTTMEQRGGTGSDDIPVDMIPVPEYIEPHVAKLVSRLKEKARKRRSGKIDEKKVDGILEGDKPGNISDDKKKADGTEKKAKHRTGKKPEHKIEDKNSFEENKVEGSIEEKKAEDKLVVKEKIAKLTEEGPLRTLKLVFGEDIRCAQVPLNCCILRLRGIIQDRFPNSIAFLIKYKDREGDMVTITTTEELRWAEASAEHGSVKLHIFEVNPDQDPLFDKVNKKENIHKFDGKQDRILENGSVEKSKEYMKKPCCINDWIVEFAHSFKNYVGFDSDAYLDLHEVGMKLYSEAMEEIVTSEEAQDLFCTAMEKFQEMAALAMFNWGNVHMTRARKRVFFTEDASTESMLEQVKVAYSWAQDEYMKAGMRYEEALKIKPDFYEAMLALGQQQFEQAKLSWYYAIGTNVDLESWPSTEVLQLYNNAEENMEKGMQMWEEVEQQRLTELCRPSKMNSILQKLKWDDFFKDLSVDEAAEQAANLRSQINVLWGSMLYERSIMEFKLEIPVWHECLEVAVEKFELAGASPTDIAVMLKNHCSNDAAVEGLGFNIDEIVQAWNEMYEAKKWLSGIPSFRLEPLLRRRVSKIYHALEHA